MSYTHAERQAGNPGSAPQSNGAWFPGWGFMRFWEPSKAPSPNHGFRSNADGDGDEIVAPGAAVASSWTGSARAAIEALGMGLHPRRR